MKFYDYIQETSKTWNHQGSNFDRAHIDLGLFSSFGKLCAEVKKVFNPTEQVDQKVILLEAGDLCYYLARWAVEHMKTDEVRGYNFDSLLAWHEGPVYIHGINNQLQKIIETKEGHYLRNCMINIAHLLGAFGYTLHDCYITNLIKLTEKYPDKFTKTYINILKEKSEAK